MNYKKFLQNKLIHRLDSGFNVPESSLNQALMPFQKACVQWALKKGKSALFEDCGLGKTIQQLEWANQIHKKENKPVLILAPLAVSLQTKQEGEKFGIAVNVCASQDDVINGINITNYEKLHKFSSEDFIGIVLDEASILKSFSGTMKNQIINAFRNTKYKLECTATPSPNDFLEIGNHSDFLGVMPSNEMISRWFINDSMNFGSYRLKKYATKDFWDWVSSWAICIEKPSDLGSKYLDAKFVLPKLSIIRHEIDFDFGEHKQPGRLFYTPQMSSTDMHKTLRLTANARAEKVAEIIGDNKNNESWGIWCHSNYEADALKKALPNAVEIRGSDSLDDKAKKMIGFVNGNFKILITKPKIAGYGMNWQHCHNVIYIGMSYSYESYYQSIRRFWRYGQEHQVNVHVVSSYAEKKLLETVLLKERQHLQMKSEMQKKINLLREKEKLKMDFSLKKKTGKNWKLYLGDSVEVVKKIKSNKIDFTIFSPPFSNLYIYSDSIRDMGNCKDDKEFFKHFKFLISEMYRATKPGRLCAVHCKNLVYYKNSRGSAGLRDFRGEIIKQFIKLGWDYHSEVCIWKDPVVEMQRTKCHGLLHKQVAKDSTFSRQGLPDYLVVFRKWAKEEKDKILIEPVVGKNSDVRFSSFSGEENIKPFGNKKDSILVWQKYASPVWFDIRQTDVLNVKQARDNKDEKHICPLQLGVIERAIDLWSNPGDVIFSPFAGIGSEGYIALKMKRKFIGIELKEAYYNVAERNLKNAELAFKGLIK